MTELLPVTQADRDRVQAFHSAMLDKLMTAVKDKAAGSRFGEDEGDAGTLVQMFAAHRIAATPAPDSEKLREAVFDALHTFERLRDLTPMRANAHNSTDLHLSVRAIAISAMDRLAPALGASA